MIRTQFIRLSAVAAGRPAKGLRLFSPRTYATSVELTTPNGHKYTQPTGLFIGGQFVPSKSGKKFESISPATEKVITEVYEASEEDAEDAVKAAEKALPIWSQLPNDDRQNYMLKIADQIEAKRELFASVETWDNGKTLTMALGDVDAVIATFRNYAGWATKIFGDVIETDPDHFTYVRREPIGVCGMVIPWNFPLMMLAWKIAPAMACGCSLVLKTAESTPLSALLFAEIVKDVGVPAGTVNILSAFGPVGGYLASHPRVKKIAFTGSTRTGRMIMEAAAKSNLKKVTLELGGKSANIVFDDCDIPTAVKNVMTGIFYNSGEVCCAGSRLYLHDTFYDTFMNALKEEVNKVVVGDPFDPKTTYGAQTSKVQLDRILGYVKKGLDEGGKLVTGGHRKAGKGFYVEPTIFSNVNNNATIAKEEIFGPVLTVIRFKTVDEAIALANDNNYGLAAGIQTKNLDRAIYTANRLRAGSVWINTYNDIHYQVPFGGYGESGIGRELGKYALNNFTEVKAVRMAGVLNGKN